MHMLTSPTNGECIPTPKNAIIGSWIKFNSPPPMQSDLGLGYIMYIDPITLMMQARFPKAGLDKWITGTNFGQYTVINS
jgi:hypothetical protein